MDERDRLLLQLMAAGPGLVAAQDPANRERLDRLVELGFAILVPREDPFHRPMPPVYQITELGRGALAGE